MKHLLLILSLMIAGNAWCQTLTTQNGTTTLGGAALTGAAITNNYASGNAAIVLSNNVTVDATHTITAGGFIGTGGPGYLALSNAANTDYTVFVGAPSNSFNVPMIFRSTETNTTMGAGVIHSTSAGGRTSSAVVETDLTLADNTTANASTSAHGFVKKLPNDATKYYDGTGNYTVPAGGGGGTSVTNCFVIMTNAVLNNVNTNTSGAIQQLCALAWNHVAAVNGRAALDLMADQAGGTTFVRLNGKAVDTTVAVTIAMDYTNGFCAYLSNNATWYLTNSSSGAGNDAGIVSGTFQDATIGGSGTVTSVTGSQGIQVSNGTSTPNVGALGNLVSNGMAQVFTLSNNFGVDVTHAFYPTNVGVSKLAGTDASGALTNIVIGSGLTLSSGSLSASGGGLGYTMYADARVNVVNPASATTYYIGDGVNLALGTSSSQVQMVVPKTGTLKSIRLSARCNGTSGTSENVTYYATNLTAVTASANATTTWTTGVRLASSTGLSLAVTAGDNLVIAILTPTWSTAPTSVTVMAYVYIE